MDWEHDIPKPIHVGVGAGVEVIAPYLQDDSTLMYLNFCGNRGIIFTPNHTTTDAMKSSCLSELHAHGALVSEQGDFDDY